MGRAMCSIRESWKSDNPEPPHTMSASLHDYKTGEYLREATESEAFASAEASDTGVILVEIDGKETACYVSE